MRLWHKMSLLALFFIFINISKIASTLIQDNFEIIEENIIIQEETIEEKVFPYKAQEPLSGDCGPASAAMIVEYITNNYTTIKDMRNIIGYKREDGGIDLYEMELMLDTKKIKYHYVNIEDYNGELAIILLTMEKISNRPKSYAGGHYLIITGIEGTYYTIEDPWNGSNLKYLISEVNNAIKRIIIIDKN